MIGFTVGLLIGVFFGFSTACLMTAISETRNENSIRKYQQGKVDGAKEFAEWIVRKNGYLNLFINDSNNLLAEYEKENEE